MAHLQPFYNSRGYYLPIWNDPTADVGWGNPAPPGTLRCQAVYCTSNGLWFSNINSIIVDDNPKDWYADFADAIVKAQHVDGYWPPEEYGGTYAILETDWALLTLWKTAGRSLDIQDYEDTLFSGSFNSTLFDLRVTEDSSGTITDFSADSTDFGTSGNIWELEVFNNELYMCIGDTLYSPDVTVVSEEVSVSLGDPIWTVPDGDDIISMLTIDSMLLIGTGIEASTNNSYDLHTGYIYTYNGSIVESGVVGSGVQCLILAGTTCEPEHLEMEVAAYAEDGPSGWVNAENQCVSPEDFDADEIKYEITITPNGQTDAQGLVMTVMLPDNVDFVDVDADDSGAYDDNSHGVLWLLGDISPDADPVIRTLIVKVNNSSVPDQSITTVHGLENDNFQIIDNYNKPTVCCWGEGILYVDQGNTGLQNGRSWETALTSLSSALNHAATSASDCYSEIWVAAGTYPLQTANPEDTFALPEGFSKGFFIYGGFAGTESTPEGRDLGNPANETVLSGYGEVDYVVTGGNNTILDGFTVTGGDLAGGIYCNNSSMTIRNCKVMQNEGYGVVIDTDSEDIKIINSWICDNGMGGSYTDGIYIYNPNGDVLIRNCTIANNTGYGIKDYYDSVVSVVTNSIIWGNGSGPVLNCNPTYSCFEGGTGTNIGTDPLFAGVGDYHITSDSDCKNAGFSDVTNNSGDTTTIKVADSSLYVADNVIEIGDDDVPRIVYSSTGGTVTFAPALGSASQSGTSVVNWIRTHDFEDTTTADGDTTSMVVDKAEHYRVNDTLKIGTSYVVVTVVDIESDIVRFSPAISEVTSETIVHLWSIARETDIDSEPRLAGSAVDIGADEHPPVSVYAGADKEGLFSVNTGTVVIDFDDAELTRIDEPATLSDLQVEWRLIYGPASGVSNFNAQKYALNPTFTFIEIGWYQFELAATSSGVVQGFDRVLIWIGIGMNVTCDPVTIPDNGTLTATDFSGGTPEEVSWVGPEFDAVTFDTNPSTVTNGSATTPVAFNAGPAKYQLKGVALDIDGHYLGEDDVWVPVGHHSVTVGASAFPPEITWPANRVQLIGTISGYVAHQITWEVPESVQDLIRIDDPHSLLTWAEFDEPMEVEIALIAEDEWGYIIGVAIVTVKVNIPNYNLLTVDAGADQEITLPQNFTFLTGKVKNGNAGDTSEWVSSAPVADGLPFDAGELVYFENPASLATKIVFAEAGEYELGLVVKDSVGNIVGFDSLWVTVNHEQVVVDAGQDQTRLYNSSGVTFDLNGQVKSGNYDTIEWINPAPSYVTIDNTQNLQTTVTITQAGQFEFGLVAKDDSENILAADAVMLTVNYQEVVVDAGPDKEITHFYYPMNCEVALHGKIVQGNPEAVEWVLPQAANIEVHGDLTSLDTWLRFSEPGIYTVGLAAKDGGVVLGWDTVVISVYPDVIDTSVEVTSDRYELTLTETPADNKVILNADVTGTYEPSWTYEWRHFAPDGYLILTETVTTEPFECEVEFLKGGVYDIAFQLRNGDGNVVAFGKVTITVNQIIWERVKFEIEADPAEVILPSAGHVTVNLNATVPAGSYYIEWHDPTGLLLFDNYLAEDTYLTFYHDDKPGVYDVEFIIKDMDINGDILGVMSIPVTVRPHGYQAVEINAGDDIEIDLPVSGEYIITLNGNVIKDDALRCDSFKWVDPSGVVNFNPEPPVSLIDQQATFTVAGIYEIALLALDASEQVIGSDIVVVTVNPFDNKALFVGIEASTTSTQLLKDDPLQLTGTVVPAVYDDIEWVVNEQVAEFVHFDVDPHDKLNTSVTFDRHGIYIIALHAKHQEQIIGWATIEISVYPPEGMVNGWIDHNSEIFDEFGTTLNDKPAQLNLGGKVIGIDETLTLTYQWTIIGDTTGQASVINDNQFTDTAILDLSGVNQDGFIQLALAVYYDSLLVGSDYMIKVVILDGNPIAEAGRYPLAVVGETFPLNKAKAWHMPDATGQTYSWTCVPGIGSINPELNPTVTFPSADEYTLTLTVSDNYGSYQSEVRITAIDGAQIYAGDDKWTIPNTPVNLDDAFVNIIMPTMNYQWTVTSDNSDNVRFNSDHPTLPGDKVLNPTVTFSAEDDYILELSINSNVAPYTNPDTVTIHVEPPPEWLVDSEPPTITLEAEQGGTSVSGQENIHGDIDVTAEAQDENIDRIELNVTGPGLINANNYEILGGTADKPIELRLTHTLDTYTSGSVTIQATAYDKAGNSNNASILFDSDHQIQGFSLEIKDADEPVDFITALSNTLTFSGILNSSLDWQIQIWDAYDTLIYTSSTYPGPDVSLINTASNFNISTAGTHKAVLTAGGHTASIYFDVVVGISTSDLEGYIDPDYRYDVPYGVVPYKDKPVITEGLFDGIYGKAYHPVFPEAVSYKIELYDSRVGNYLGFDEYNWEPAFWVKNITPGPLDENGFRNATIGTVGTMDSFGELDFTSVENGIYELLLTVKCHDLVKYDHTPIILECPLKVGNVKFSQEDLSITIGGVPLRVIRTYDGFKKHDNGDFGFGWTYSLANMDIRLNESRDEQDVRSGGNFDRGITITLPDGQRATYTMYMSGGDGFQNLGQALYSKPPGVTASLETEPAYYLSAAMGTGYTYQYWNNQGTYINGNAAQHDFAGYKLELEDGTVYHIKREGHYEDIINSYGFEQEIERYGKPYLSSVELVSGEEIVFDVDKSDRHNPVIREVIYKDVDKNILTSIKIIRDGQGRVIAINAPSEADETVESGTPTIKYEYDAWGNLSKVHKLVDKDSAEYETITYLYSDSVYHPADHYVTDILDPRGIRPILYIYDWSGKLVATKDAKGNEIRISHDVTGNIETVTDRNGNITIFEYNTRGNIVSVTNSLSQTTIYEYADAGYKDAPIVTKVPLVDAPGENDYAITTAEYDSSGRPLKVTGPEGNITQNVYDYYDGKLLTSTQKLPVSGDEVLTTENIYDDKDRLIFTGTKKGSVWYSMNLTYYNDFGYIDDTVQINTNEVSDMTQVFSSGSQLVNIDLLPSEGNHVRTTYLYDSASNSSDKPYSISEPYADNGTAVYNHFFHYDENGDQDYSWYIKDSTYVFNVNKYDAQDRVIETRRVIDDDINPLNDFLEEVVLSSIVYNSIGKVERSYDELGNYTAYEYDEVGNVVETRTCDSQDNCLTTSQSLYDAEGMVLVTVGPYATGDEPVGTETVYDSLGRVIETRRWKNVTINLIDLIVDGENVGKTVEFDPDAGIIIANAWDGTGTQPESIGWKSEGILPVIMSPPLSPGQIAPLSYTRTVYDGGGRVKHSVSLSEPVWDVAANGDNGAWVSEEQITTYRYDKASKQTLIADPLGHDIDDHYAEARVLNDDSVPEITIAKEIDFSSFVFDYDTDLDGSHQTTTQYEGTRRSAVTDASGNTTSFEYDDLGRLEKTKHPKTVVEEGGTTPIHTFSHVGYDGLGRKAWQSQMTNIETSVPDSEIKDFYYNSAGRLTAVLLPPVDIEHPDSGNTEIISARSQYEYKYDTYGNLEESWDNVYEDLTNAVLIYDYKRVTKFTYDEQNRKTSREMPDGNKEYWDYDDYSRVKVHIDFKEQAIGYFYNDRGQLQYKCYYDADGTVDGWNDNYVEANPDTGYTARTVYTYDNLGRKETVTDTRGTTTYNYDNEGRIYQLDTPEGTINYDYDSVTGQKTRTYSDKTVTDYFYDELSRLETVNLIERDAEDIDDEQSDYTYNPVGSRDALTYANGNYTYHVYDAINRLTSLTNFEQFEADPQNPTGNTLSKFEYELYADGMRRKAAEEILPQGITPGPSSLKTQVVTYTYDNLNRLTKEVGDDPDNTDKGYTVEYGYDLVGNRLSRAVYFEHRADELLTEYQYDDKDQLLKETHTDDVPWVAIQHNNGPYYAYAGESGIFYTRANSKVKIGPFKAWLIGLPSSFSHWLFGLVTALLIVAFLLPAIIYILARIRKREPTKMPLSLRNRCISVLLAYLMIVGPAGFEQIAHASTQYSDLGTSSWGTHNRIIEYGEWDGTSGRTGNFTTGYDANGSVTKKITWNTHSTTTDPIDHTKIEEVTYEYNLRNRLKRVVSDSDPASGNNVVDVVDYKYNDAGIRVEKYTFKVAQNYLGTEEDEQTNATNKKTTIYLVEQYNHTGYTQVLEEATYEKADPDIATDTPASRITYTIGDDVITQAKAVYNGGDPTDPANWTFNDPQHQLYDGHGSTRQLVTDSVPNTTIVDDFSYDGYGVLLQDEDNFPPEGTQVPGKVEPQATNLLYAGEHFDTDSQNYYNRARWYNPLTGLFNRIDPYEGNRQDPQSLHKYLYCHNNPVNAIDPSGLLGIIGITLSITTISILAGLIAGAINKFLFGGSFLETFIQVTMTTFLALGMSAVYPPIAPWSYTIATFITQVLWEWIVNGFENPAESIARILFMTILSGLMSIVARAVNVSQFMSFDADRLIHAIGMKDAVRRIAVETGKLTLKGLSVFAGIKRISKELMNVFFVLLGMPRRDLEREYRRAVG